MRTDEQENLLNEYSKSLEYVKTLTESERKIFVSGMHMANVYNDLHCTMTLEQNYAWCCSAGMQDDPRVKVIGEYIKKKEELKNKKWWQRIWA